MPYIESRSRKEIDPELKPILDYIKENVPLPSGDYNYIITRICNSIIMSNGLKYSVINEVVGVLECVKQELYRRVAVPYEDRKKIQNGDVY